MRGRSPPLPFLKFSWRSSLGALTQLAAGLAIHDCVIFQALQEAGEGAAGLHGCRMRMDPKNDNYNMFDLIAYRIKYVPHPHAGSQW